MRIVLLTLFVICSSITFSQTMGTDREGKSVYEFQKSQTFNLPISSADNSAKLNLSWKIGEGTQYFGKHSTVSRINDSLKNIIKPEDINFDTSKNSYSSLDSTRLTMAKSWGFNASFKVANLLSNLAKITTFHPKYSLNAGIGRNIDVFNNWENIALLTFPFNNWNLNFGIEKDEVKIYDTVSKRASDFQQLWTKTISANGSLYFPRLFSSTLIGVSTVLNYEIGNNISDLKKYQENKSLYIDNNITTLGDYVGRIGDLKDQNSFRASFSINIFPSLRSLYFKNDTIQLCIIPYSSFYGPIHSQLNKLVGLYINASQGKSIFSKNSIIKSGIGLGIDWVVSPSGLNNVSVFVGGSLDIHSFFAHKKPVGLETE